MRIAEVNDIASVAVGFTAGLTALGHDATFIQPRLYGARLPGAVKPVVLPIRIVEWLGDARRLRRERYDVAHIHYAYMGVVGRLARIPYVLHCHGTDLRDLANPLRRPIIVAALKGAERVLYATPDLKELIVPYRADAEFMPNPVDTDEFAPRPEEPDEPDIYICCALTPKKGVENILATCRQLAEERPDIRITAVAGGPHRDAFARLPNVLLIARQPRFKLPGFIARHKVVLGQIHHGAIGQAEVESMSCGRPVVANFSHDAAYDEAPPLVKVSNAAEAVRALSELVDDADRRLDLSQHSRAWILANHNLATIAKHVEAVLYDAACVDPAPTAT